MVACWIEQIQRLGHEHISVGVEKLRKRLALGLLKASERVAPPAASPQDPVMDFEEDAGLEELPTLEPIAISERVLTRSMRSLKVEAFTALGALHAAHVAASNYCALCAY